MNPALPFEPHDIGRPRVSDHWCLTRDGDPQALDLFRRHYTCKHPERKLGRGNANRFAGQGETIVLIESHGRALCVWNRQAHRLDKQIGVCCSVFRNESPVLSSQLIREAVAVAADRWPGRRLFTFVDAAAVRSSNLGACFRAAGWQPCGRSAARSLLILEHIPLLDEPPPPPPIPDHALVPPPSPVRLGSELAPAAASRRATPPPPPVPAATTTPTGHSYIGGKNAPGTYQQLINQIPPHTHWVELFAGSGALTRLKRPALSSIAVESEPRAAAQLRRLTVPGLEVVEGCAFAFLSSHRFDANTFVYADPPYLHSTRAAGRSWYRHELREPDHVRLLDLLRNLPCPVMLSGYFSELYAAELPGWRSISFAVYTRGHTKATEWAWMNYPEPPALHDYTWVGAGYRARECIRRKAARWRRMLLAMPLRERQAILAHVRDLAPGGDSSG